MFKLLKKFLRDEQFNEFLLSLFRYFNDINFVRMQSQLLRCMLLVEADNDIKGMFIMNVSNIGLRFGLNGFAAVTELQCCPPVNLFQIHLSQIG